MILGDDGLLPPATTAVEKTAKGAAINKIIDAGLAATPELNIRARLLHLGQAVHFKTALLPQVQLVVAYSALLAAEGKKTHMVVAVDAKKTRVQSLISFSTDTADLSVDGLKDAGTSTERIQQLETALEKLDATNGVTIRTRMLDLGTTEAIRIGGILQIGALKLGYKGLLQGQLSKLKPGTTVMANRCEMCGVHGAKAQEEATMGGWTPAMCGTHWDKMCSALSLLDRALVPGSTDFPGACKQFVTRFGPVGCRVCKEDIDWPGHSAFCLCDRHKGPVKKRFKHLTLGKIKFSNKDHPLFVPMLQEATA
jgi:hypothetical protein